LRVLITGASGFIGFPLSNKLSELGFKVLAIGRSIPVNGHKSISWIKSDLNSVETYKDEITAFKPEVLIHLAWQDIPDFSFEKSFFNLNQSIKFISFIAEIKSCRKIIISGSCWEYGKDQGECKDSDKSIPTNYFTLAKHSLRLWTEMIAIEKSITLGWFRLFYVYGPGQRSESLIPTLFQYLRNEKLPEIKTPHNANDFIYIDDVIEAFKIATYTSFESGIFNLGSGSAISALDVCKHVEKIVLNSSSLSKKIEKSSKSKISETNFWADISSCREQLKWSPRISIVEGIRKSWNHLK
jgi:nucleoside-diphosphate-sugar epimerase